VRHFPLFADLRGRRALVVGGGTVAQRKIGLLLEAGASVTAVAPEFSPALSSTAAAESRLELIAGQFTETHLAGVVLAIAATDDRETNARVAAAAQTRNVLVNVVDDLELSSFIVPAIVDRSPLVIAVSSGGTAPVLARHVRERIEVLIDGSFGALAGLLERWRSRIRREYPDLGARRRLYERLMGGRVAAEMRARRPVAAEREVAREVASGDRQATGSVTLVGAGPGDPGLLTLQGLRALQEADVVLHDHLVSPEVLALARRDAERISVGKQAGQRSVSQQQIHELMLEHAGAGQRVVRLKGGDPFVFGRGGEELEFLAANGIAFSVVPGITAAVACGAYAGIPLTHRDHAQSVRFVTAHGGETIDAVDWASLAQARQTVAFYMGVARLATIGERLLAAGLDPATPVAIVENGSRAAQRVTIAKVHELGDIAELGGIASPALLVVGEVAALAQSLHWFGDEPRVWPDSAVPASATELTVGHAA
jgi:uroporphyrin-III C-methyltransferase/precorrin-2 dehydrogenase/sirohydrochlorin ferrochelatase